jgi:fumarate hydratase class II
MVEHESGYRIEHDSLGQIRVPEGALYGAQTQRAVDNFPISGLRPWRAFIWSMAQIKRAAAQVNEALGLLDPEKARAIEEAAQEVIDGRWEAEFVVDPFQAGAGTSHHMNVNEVIANRATQILGGALGEYRVHPNDDVNMAQSTNDTVPTAIRLGCLWRTAELSDVLRGLRESLREKGADFDDIVKSGRTHLQDAVPIRMGQEFSGYARAVARDAERITTAADQLRRLSGNTGIPLVESDNLFESMQSMADMVGFSASLRTLALTLTRIANDFRLLSSGPSTGLNEIDLPAVQPGSSIMPGKVNPVLAEMLNMAMYHVIGCDTTVAMASQAGQLELNVMMPIIAHNLFEMMQVTIGAVRAFTEKCVQGLKANRDRAEEWLERNAIVATALNPLIGYAAGSKLVAEALERDLTVREVAVEKARSGELTHREGGGQVEVQEVESALADMRKLTEGGIIS